MEDMIERHTWQGGPCNKTKLDFDACFPGKLCRDVSHIEWANMFTATAESQLQAIRWNHKKFGSGQSPDANAFEQIGKRFVFAVNVGKHVLTPAGVVQPMVDSFLTDVSNGMHQASFDSVLNGTLTEGLLVYNAP